MLEIRKLSPLVLAALRVVGCANENRDLPPLDGAPPGCRGDMTQAGARRRDKRDAGTGALAHTTCTATPERD